MRKFFAILLICTLMVSLFAGCGDSTESSVPEGGAVPQNSDAPEGGSSTAASGPKILQFGSNLQTTSLDPSFDYASWFVVRYGIAESLFKLDDNLVPQLWLAESYENPTPETWVFQIREGIKFHNGKDVTALEVQKSLQRQAETLERISDVLRDATYSGEGYTLTITTAGAVPTMINELCSPDAVVIDVESGEDFTTKPIGTGPFAVEKFVPSTSCELRKNADYWDGEVKLDAVTVTSITDSDTLAMALQSGEVDLAQGIPASSISLFGDDSYTKSTVSTSRVFMFYLNTEGKFTSDQALREAIDMAMDREMFCTALLNGAATPTYAAFPSMLPYGGDKIKGRAFDLAGAKKTLEDAGYEDSDGDGFYEKDGEKVSVRIITATSRPELPLYAEAVQGQLTKLGIDASIELTGDTTEPRMQSGDFEIAMYNRVTCTSGDPLPYVDDYYTGSYYNYGKYSDPDTDALIDRLRTESDPSQRAELAVQIQQRAVDSAAYINLAHLDLTMIMKSSVTGVKSHPTDFYQLTKDIDIAA